MMPCEITGRERVYDGCETLCICPDGSRVTTCYISPRRWDRSTCGYKFEYREKYVINEYNNEKFIDVDDLLERFGYMIPAGYKVKIEKDDSQFVY